MLAGGGHLARPGSSPQAPGDDRNPLRRSIPVEVKLKLDLHHIHNRGSAIETALSSVMEEAVQKKATLVEIIPGKGTGQLKRRVLRYLDQPEVKALYHKVEKDSDNWGRIFVHFRWK